jgi:hypothetical protein
MINKINGFKHCFLFYGEPGESGMIEKTAMLTPPIAWQTVHTPVGASGLMPAAAAVFLD